MNPILKNCVLYGVSQVGRRPGFCALFAGRAVIIMYHEIQRD